MKERDRSVDVLRGIGIIAVVAGHASSGMGLAPFSPYSFHMPLFFFLSGMFFREGEIEGARSLAAHIKTFLLPTTACIVFYAFLCKLLAAFGFAALDRPITLTNLFLTQFSTSGAYPFTSPYWFIPSLFLVRVYFGGVHTRLIRLTGGGTGRSLAIVEGLFLLAYLSMSVGSIVLSRELYAVKSMSLIKIGILHITFASFFYYFGFVCAKYRLQRYMAGVFVLFALYVIQQHLWATGTVLDFWMQIMKFESPILPIVTSLTGVAFFFGISQLIAAHRGASPLAYIGGKGLPIVLHQLFGFFVLNLILCGLGFIRPGDITGQYFQWHTEKTWPLYVIFGVVVPLLIDRYVVGRSKRALSNVVERWRLRITG
ncbi:acyltransferase 3 [Caballeronia fortuita]|uniref:Acyltransferase 3 n=1 Tax=Caballeronia fortuita TaxID=1777138 RepID=A0A158D385_9BURK|nr:acyltransferase family protein [Caballeronia fortuita]SAK88297.1 acyltransferase 3 [Caballeronia fortuita]